MKTHRLFFAGTILTLLVLVGCGGSGVPSPEPTPTPTPPAVAYMLVPLAPAALVGVSTSANAITPSGTQQGGLRFTNTSDMRALLWSGTSASVVDLGPGEIRALGEGVQIGLTGLEGTLSERAQLWRGTEASAVALHPTGYVASHALGGDAEIQVGRGQTTDSTSHALLWRGTAASVIDLHPTGFTFSRAYGGAGGVQVGTGRPASGQDHALLWRGTAASVVDLGLGVAWAISGDTQVGQGTVSGSTHALLWHGTQASRVDLHPTGFNDSRAFGVAGSRQVGYGSKADGTIHALLWEGTAASALDLHSTTASYLINGTAPRSSFAYGIDNNGNIVGTVRSVDGRDYAVLWKRN
jgi:hypothetical protein